MKIVFCLPGREYSRQFILSWSRLLIACSQAGHEVVISQNYSSYVTFARMKCLGGDVMAGEDQKPFQEKLEYDVMMWIDSDVIFNPEQFFALLESEHPVTAGLYMMEDLQHYATVKDWDTEFFKENGTFKFLTQEEIENWKKETGQRYMPVSYTGMGWMMIKKGVIEQIKYPWFHRPTSRIATGKEDVPELVDCTSEDTSLCLNLKEAGIQIMIDTDIRVGHLKSLII